jgi:hypothetical protein
MNEKQNEIDSPVLELTQAAPSVSDQSALSSSPQPCAIDVEPIPDHGEATSDLSNLLNSGSYRVKEERALIQRRTVEPVTTDTPDSPVNSLACVISAPPAATACLGQRMRNGKIARLPKLERDLVNKLLHNHVPYVKIVWALSERGITVTQRNISNWRTRGGYKEWCAEQENQLRVAHLQDHLTDYLRKHDAQQLPEVGLQVASTQLTSLLMNPQTAAPLLADPNKYARIVHALDTCSARLSELQNARYEDVRRARIRDTVPNLRCEEERFVESIRQTASAAKLGASAYEDEVPHRNDLPPREELPYLPPGPTMGEIVERKLNEHFNPKLLPNSASEVALTTAFGNQTETHGNVR